MQRVILKAGHVKPVYLGHPWVYRGAVSKVEGALEPGDLVAVEDPRGNAMGYGWWHPESVIALRMVRHTDGRETGKAWFVERLERARALRTACLDLGRDSAYRLLNSEGDGVPGAVVDIFGDVASVGFTSLGAWRRRDALLDALEAVVPLRAAVVADVGAPVVEGVPVSPRLVLGEGDAASARFEEHRVRYSLTLPGGQKSGAYLDQAVARGRVARLGRGGRVLDLFCYHGGFALAAAKAGAESAVGVDSSAPAIGVAAGNASDNKLGGRIRFVNEDVRRFLEAATAAGDRYDVVVVDPPPMARTKASVDQALLALVGLHRAVLPLLAPDGWLLSCSCSRHLDAPLLERMLVGAARDTGRDVQVVELGGAGPDHPVLLPCVEGRYLTSLLCRVR